MVTLLVTSQEELDELAGLDPAQTAALTSAHAQVIIRDFPIEDGKYKPLVTLGFSLPPLDYLIDDSDVSVVIGDLYGDTRVHVAHASSVTVMHGSSGFVHVSDAHRVQADDFHGGLAIEGDAQASAWCCTDVRVLGNAVLTARDCTVTAFGDAHVYASGSRVTAHSWSRVEAREASRVLAGGQSYITVWDSSSVEVNPESDTRGQYVFVVQKSRDAQVGLEFSKYLDFGEEDSDD